ncbi:MAG: aspartate aminotransferase family protein [Anaerolineae bacterium]|nr:aspartate aminotransferase family protein [Anaerolineae bacterium]
MSPEEFRRVGHQIIDWIADYRANMAEYPVMSGVAPGEIRAKLPASPPEQPEDFAAILADMDDIVLPGLTRWNHPRFFGYFPANASLASVLGDFLSSGLGVIGLNWQASPALTEVEEVMADWLRQMLDLSPAWSGVIQDTASTSSLIALLSAREWATGHSQAQGGLQAEAAPLVVYCSTQSHSSVEKAALLAGFGRANVRAIDTDENYAMRVDMLEAAIEADLAAGRKPAAVVATIGTTTSTALDPIAPIAALTQAHGLWLHVDTAMAGSAMILPECRWMWQGVEQADSLVLNPHKWLGAVFDCSLYYVRNPEHLMRVMSTNPSYLQTSADGQAKNFRDWGIPLGRRFRSLKLWCLIREQGVAGLQARLRRDLANAQWLKAEVEAAPDWEVLAPVQLQTVCVRHVPPGLSGEALDRHTRAWAEQLNRSGRAYVTPAKLGGRWVVRVSIGAEPTELADVQALWAEMQIEATQESDRTEVRQRE